MLKPLSEQEIIENLDQLKVNSLKIKEELVKIGKEEKVYTVSDFLTKLEMSRYIGLAIFYYEEYNSS